MGKKLRATKEKAAGKARKRTSRLFVGKRVFNPNKPVPFTILFRRKLSRFKTNKTN